MVNDIPTGSDCPLAGVRVVETADAATEMTGRYLAELGADVIKVEPRGGSPSRRLAPLAPGMSLRFLTHNVGKRSVVLDLAMPEDRVPFLDLLNSADIWIDGRESGSLDELGVTPDEALARFPHLVILSVTPFGRTGPYRDWNATDAVHLAMGGVLARSGIPGRVPVIPPGNMASATTAMQAAFASLLGYWNRLETGHGDYIDFSLYEATAQVIDPGLGTVGTAQAAGYPESRGRPEPGPYPIFPCADGHVRLVILAPRQWRAMRAWLGEPAELQDPNLDTIRGRAMAAQRITPYYAELFRDRCKLALTEEGQQRGVPIAPVLTLSDVLDAEHFRIRGALQEIEAAPGVTVTAPSGFVEIDGVRCRPRRQAPLAGEHNAEIFPSDKGIVRRPAPAAPPVERRPLEGLRVLDLGVIVMGAEIAKLFADQGAEVIKIENAAFPDGARVSEIHFAIGHRNSKSVGLNLRDPQGQELFKRLVARADVVLSNFKPGTLEKLGIGYASLRSINPGLVMVNSSAMGHSGPWSAWMGYGPLVRCSAGLSDLWRYPDDPEGFSDGTTIHPDHYAARITGSAALAALIGRRRHGDGALVTSAQADALLMQLAPLIAEESLRPGTGGPIGNGSRWAAPWGIYPCAGDDEWIAITVRNDADWTAMRAELGDPAWASGPELDRAAGRIAARTMIDRELTQWTSQFNPRELTERLQQRGIPAGFMQRIQEYEQDPHLQARAFFRTFEQPGLDPLTVERAPFLARRIPVPRAEPAPAIGEHTREVCEGVLGLAPSEIEALLAAGVLEEPAAVLSASSS